MKLSVVFTGRNVQYSGDFRGRTLAALARNQKEAKKVGVSVEWLFVEWNPLLDTDFLSYRLALRGCRCYVVDPKWHKKLLAPAMVFSQSFAKNVGIRRALGEWILVTCADDVFDDQVWLNIAAGLDPRFLYRVERCDVDWHLFDEPFEVLRHNVIRRHTSSGFTQAAGDFLLFPAERRFGFDEAINDSDLGTDGRFCENWSALMSNGALGNIGVFRFIGDIFKADHPLTYVNTRGSGKPNAKGRMHWNYRIRTCPGPALYQNKPNWGLRDAKQRKLREGVWYLDY